MHKDAIADLLEEKYHKLLLLLENQPVEHWMSGPPDDCTIGQVAFYLLKNIKPLNDALSMPRFLLRYVYGTYDGTIKDYADVILQYQEKTTTMDNVLSQRKKRLKVPKIKDKSYFMTRLQVESKKLQYKIRRISDRNLDTLVLPHPVMGKMPIRELLMLTAYDVEQHSIILKEKY